jgi:hypothetical protein
VSTDHHPAKTYKPDTILRTPRCSHVHLMQQNKLMFDSQHSRSAVGMYNRKHRLYHRRVNKNKTVRQQQNSERHLGRMRDDELSGRKGGGCALRRRAARARRIDRRHRRRATARNHCEAHWRQAIVINHRFSGDVVVNKRMSLPWHKIGFVAHDIGACQQSDARIGKQRSKTGRCRRRWRRRQAQQTGAGQRDARLLLRQLLWCGIAWQCRRSLRLYAQHVDERIDRRRLIVRTAAFW